MLEKKNNLENYIALLSILFTNGIVVYGVFELGWSFFMVIYSYWFGELFSTIFDIIKYRTVKNRKELPPGSTRESGGRFLFLFVYWVFIVLIAGFIAAPENTFGENILVIIFFNRWFNISLLCVLLGEFVVYYQRFVLSRNYRPENIVQQNSMINRRTMIMHISIIAGAVAWFSMHFEGFFIHFEPGPYGEYVFMLIFVAIRVVGELVGLNLSFSGKEGE